MMAAFKRRGKCIPYDFFLKVSEGRVGVWVLRQLAQAWFSAIARHAHDVVLGCVLYSLSCHQELQFLQPARQKTCCLDCLKCQHGSLTASILRMASSVHLLVASRTCQCRAGLVKQCSRDVTVERPLTDLPGCASSAKKAAKAANRARAWGRSPT